MQYIVVKNTNYSVNGGFEPVTGKRCGGYAVSGKGAQGTGRRAQGAAKGRRAQGSELLGRQSGDYDHSILI
jgi:hypothetical protein